jgi:hypothetical protein
MAELEDDHAIDTDNLETLIDELEKSNKLLRKKLKATAKRLEEANGTIWALTGGGKPAPEDPCGLCGRMGREFVEEVGVRVEPWEGEEITETKVQSEETAKEVIKPRLTQGRSGWKDWEDGPGCYTIKVKDAPYHHELRRKKLRAIRHEEDDRMVEGDEELLAMCSEEEEKVWKPAVAYPGMEGDEGGVESAGGWADQEGAGDVQGAADEQKTDSFW